jgi:hypothetical protein
MATAEGPQERPVRREVIELIRRLDLFGAHPASKALLGPGDQEMLASATEAEKRAAAREVLRDMAKVGNIVTMEDGTTATLPDDPDWA